MSIQPTSIRQSGTTGAEFAVLFAVSFSHLINDALQALLPSVYPILQGKFQLSFTQLGVLTLIYQITACVLQPFAGHYTDGRPTPYSLPFGMTSTMAGVMVLAFASSYEMVIFGSVLMGIGSSIFHPEASRIARLASGGSHGMAQSLFQVGGNFGAALGPLAAAYVVLPLGMTAMGWFALLAFGGILILTALGNWYRSNSHESRFTQKSAGRHPALTSGQVNKAIFVLIALLFSKFVYTSSFTSFYIFYLIDRFDVSSQTAQILQFVFMASVAIGTIAGGPIGDRIGRKGVIWLSILGALPFSLILPHVGLVPTVVLSALVGLLLSSAFPAIIVYGQELMPGRVGMASGLFFGFAFGIGGIGTALLGSLADWKGIYVVFQLCSILPAIGILAVYLPNLRVLKEEQRR